MDFFLPGTSKRHPSSQVINIIGAGVLGSVLIIRIEMNVLLRGYNNVLCHICYYCV